MKIQIIAYDKAAEYNNDNIFTSTHGSPNSLDEFDINIIDTRNSSIWINDDNVKTSINKIDEFHHLKEMISSARMSQTIILIPSNLVFRYFYGNAGGRLRDYLKSSELKNMLPQVSQYLFSELTGFTPLRLKYEPTKTLIGEFEVKADFYYLFDESFVLTKSIKSNKPTTINLNGIFFSSLNLPHSSKAIFSFLQTLGLLEDKQKEPEWFSDIIKYDDDNQKEVLIKAVEEQTLLDAKKETAIQKLDENNKLKSILYTNSDELVQEVFVILEELLECDLSRFIDEKNEDFIIEKEEVVFIGEIKGVTSNVKNEHVSQLDVHVQNYMDNLTEDKKGMAVKGLLIINPLRNGPPTERATVGNAQIVLARRNSALIITTYELLDLHEKFRNGEISSSDIINAFTKETGQFKNS